MDKMMSLYDYLGRPAGSDLGKQVYLAAVYRNITVELREISNPKYTGNVMLYPESFLKEYFKPKNDTQQPKEDLPF
jgi:hypothetical protein